MSSFQVENIDLLPEEYVNKNLFASRRTNTRKHGRLWEFYKYYKDKKGLGKIYEKVGADLSLVENYNNLYNDIDLKLNKSWG